MAKKVTRAQLEERCAIVMQLLLDDTTRPEILSHVATTWGVKTRSGDRYIARAGAMIQSEGERLREQSFGHHLVKLKTMRHSALQAGDNRLALDLLKETAKLLGLYPPKESKTTSLDIEMSQLSDDQLRRIADGHDPLAVLASGKKTV